MSELPPILKSATLSASYNAALSTDALGQQVGPWQGVLADQEVAQLVDAAKGRCPAHTLLAARILLGRARHELARAAAGVTSSSTPAARAELSRWQITERNTHALVH